MALSMSVGLYVFSYGTRLMEVEEVQAITSIYSPEFHQYISILFNYLIVPGVILAIGFFWTFYLIADKGLGAIEAMKPSRSSLLNGADSTARIRPAIRIIGGARVCRCRSEAPLVTARFSNPLKSIRLPRYPSLPLEPYVEESTSNRPAMPKPAVLNHLVQLDARPARRVACSQAARDGRLVMLDSAYEDCGAEQAQQHGDDKLDYCALMQCRVCSSP